MRYVIAGYVFVLFVLALYSVQLIWRRRRLAQAVDRAAGPGAVASTSGTLAAGAVTSNRAGEVVP